jgi:hypothetical protein
MRKIAIFVEGLKEMLFVDRLVQELAEESGLAVEHAEAIGGAVRARQIRVLKRLTIQPHHQYYVLIVNCAGDSNVKSDIIERYHGLKRSGYSAIIGLRDVYGQFRYEDVARLRGALEVGMPKKEDLPIELLLAVMEIEAWFLGEYTHFERVSPNLKLERIRAALQFDPSTDDLEKRKHPTEDLDHIYQLAGLRYSKQRNNLERTVALLDFRFFISNVSRRFPDAGRLIAVLGNQLSG